MGLLKHSIKMPLWLFYLAVIILLTGVFAIAFIWNDNPKFVALSGGLLSGLIVFLFQYALQIHSLIRLDKFEEMGVIQLLDNRHRKDYYRPVVGRAKSEIKVMGTSCARFIQDFMDVESDDKAVINALHKHSDLKVRLLIPDDTYMEETDKNRWIAEKKKLVKAIQEFGHRIEIRRFAEPARSSLVLADDQLIVGPVFPGDDSRNTPAVHVRTNTGLGEKYRKYFNSVWDKAKVESFT